VNKVVSGAFIGSRGADILNPVQRPEVAFSSQINRKDKYFFLNYQEIYLKNDSFSV